MIRILVFIVKLALVIAAAVWLADHPGLITIDWQGYRISTSLAVLVLFVLALVIVAVFVHTLWRALVSVPRSLSLAHLSHRQRKGYLALTQGLVAVAAGDAHAARRFAHRAEKLLNEPPLTLLLQAQAAQLSGDEASAERYFNAMLEKPATSFMGLRGLLTQAMKKGDSREALALARKAKLLQPKAGWVQSALTELEARNGHWTTALETLGPAIRSGAIAPDKGRRLRATLLLGESRQAEGLGQRDGALRLARRAYEVAPQFVPAAIGYARLLVAAQQLRLAQKIIERSWRTTPHPELAQLYAEAGGVLTPAQQVKRFERLKSFNPAAPDSALALAEKALAAQLWGVARDQLAPLLASGPSAAACRLMAEVEEKELSNQRVARDWLARAATAPAGAQWQCSACQTPAHSWSPLCLTCQSLGTLDWGSLDWGKGEPPSLRLTAAG